MERLGDDLPFDLLVDEQDGYRHPEGHHGKRGDSPPCPPRTLRRGSFSISHSASG